MSCWLTIGLSYWHVTSTGRGSKSTCKPTIGWTNVEWHVNCQKNTKYRNFKLSLSLVRFSLNLSLSLSLSVQSHTNQHRFPYLYVWNTHVQKLRSLRGDFNGGSGLERIGLHWIPSQLRPRLSISSSSASRLGSRFPFLFRSFSVAFTVCFDVEMRLSICIWFWLNFCCLQK